MPNGAARLLARLQKGDSFGIPSVYPGWATFSDHAQVYLESAVAVASHGPPADFAVFSALFCLRHGLELWLKCIIRNELIDSFLVAAMADEGLPLPDVLAAVPGLRTGQHAAITTALVVLQNVRERRLVYPECWTENLSETESALNFLRANRDLSRNYFADVCRVQVSGHRLDKLWTQAKATITGGLHREVASTAPMYFQEPVVAASEIENAVLLMHHLDPGGTVLRYPEERSGEPNTELPAMHLPALSALAGSLNNTLMAYSAVRSEVYDLATLRSPRLRW